MTYDVNFTIMDAQKEIAAISIKVKSLEDARIALDHLITRSNKEIEMEQLNLDNKLDWLIEHAKSVDLRLEKMDQKFDHKLDRIMWFMLTLSVGAIGALLRIYGVI